MDTGWKRDAFMWNNKSYIDSFKLLKLSVVVNESKNEATYSYSKYCVLFFITLENGS